jgi:hypothetical protein
VLGPALVTGCESTPEIGLGNGNADPVPETGDGDPSFGVPIVNCDPDDEAACPSGQKCTIIGVDTVDSVQNVYDCVDDPGLLLEYAACTPDRSTGIDGCPPGFACLTTSEDDLDNGICVELCLDSDGCEDGVCLPHVYSEIPTCADYCDPLSALCPPGQDCFPNESDFICRLVTDVDTGAVGDDCYWEVGCGPSLVCLTGAILNGCSAEYCCSDICDLEGTDQCETPTSCNPYFDDPAPYLERVGACYVPTG